MGDEDHRRVERLELALEPLEVLDVEVVRRLVEEEQVGARPRARARARRASALRPRTCRAAGRGRRRRSRARARPRRRGRATPSLRRARAAPAPRRSGGASPRRARPSAIAVLEPPQLVLDVEQVARAREGVLAEREVELERRALVVERDARPLRERELAALERGLAGDRAQERRLAGAVRPGEREPVLAPDRERDASKSGSPENSLRSLDAMRTAMTAEG